MIMHALIRRAKNLVIGRTWNVGTSAILSQAVINQLPLTSQVTYRINLVAHKWQIERKADRNLT